MALRIEDYAIMHSTHGRAARRLYVRETWLKADLAIVKAWRADPAELDVPQARAA